MIEHRQHYYIAKHQLLFLSAMKVLVAPNEDEFESLPPVLRRKVRPRKVTKPNLSYSNLLLSFLFSDNLNVLSINLLHPLMTPSLSSLSSTGRTLLWTGYWWCFFFFLGTAYHNEGAVLALKWSESWWKRLPLNLTSDQPKGEKITYHSFSIIHYL